MGIKDKMMEINNIIRPSNCQMLTMKNFKTNCAPQRRRLCQKMSQLQAPIQDILIFLNIHDGGGFATDVLTMGGIVERPIEIRTSAIVLDFSSHMLLLIFLSNMQWP
jgi:hypothetical protein